MTVTEIRSEIEQYLILREIKLEEEYIPNVASLTYESNYIQLLYAYGIDILLLVLDILEKHELYEQCAVLKQAIDTTNELEGLNFLTKYKYEVLNE